MVAKKYPYTLVADGATTMGWRKRARAGALGALVVRAAPDAFIVPVVRVAFVVLIALVALIAMASCVVDSDGASFAGGGASFTGSGVPFTDSVAPSGDGAPFAGGASFTGGVPSAGIARAAVSTDIGNVRRGYRQYLVGDREERRRLRRLWSEMATHTLRDPRGITALEFYARRLIEQNRPELMHRLLTTRVLRDLDNPYNAVIFSLLANYYAEIGENLLAAYYYQQIIANYQDIRYKNESAHFRALIALTSLTDDARALAGYHQMLVYRFPDRIDVFDGHQRMIEQYRRAAEWQLLFQGYRQLLDACAAQVDLCQDPERAAYIDTIRARLRFAEADRYWTTDDLDLLVGRIKAALSTQSVSQLLNWRAQVNFFARSWEQEEFDFNSQISFNMGIFLRRSRVSFAQEIDSSSNAQEAYLRTWGWSHRIPTWYFYFRKIDFPADPEVHGNWEWAGIFFGELL